MNPKSLPRAGDKAVPRALVYLRVSTPRQMHTDADAVADGNSIDTQRKEARAKVKQLGAVVAEDGEYIEPGNSAQSIEKRPVFREMLKRIAEKRDVEYVVVYMRSRAFRNALDAMTTKYQLKKLGVKLVSAKEDFGDGIWADAMEAITDVVNEVQVRQNGEDIRIKMANKVMNGGTASRAKLGYLNTTIIHDGMRINTIAVDEERKPLILMAFELMATGRYTLATLHAEITRAGLRSRPTVKRPTGNPITEETLRKLLRDKYYIGWVSYRGMEYQGRHETFVPPELFERVQRVLDSHQGAGVRTRTHHHYLKGLVWCHRCGKRFIVQRAVGRHGGVYYYFFCTGRQDGTCDHPYVPVEEMEKAVARHYAGVRLPDDFRAEVRAMAEEAANSDNELSQEMRDRMAKRLDELTRKEDYFLDLAADEGWPKERLREKIGALRRERESIERSLSEAQTQLDTGRGIVMSGLRLLDNPARAYENGNETVRTILNKALFTKIMIDGKKVVADEPQEPFGTLRAAYRRSAGRAYLRTSGVASGATGAVADGSGAGTAERPAFPKEDRALGDSSLTDLLELALTLRARGSSTAVMVELWGLEPQTSCMPCKRSSQLSYSPKICQANFVVGVLQKLILPDSGQK